MTHGATHPQLYKITWLRWSLKNSRDLIAGAVASAAVKVLNRCMLGQDYELERKGTKRAPVSWSVMNWI